MNTQKIALFGVTGEVGRRLAEEALKRGHNVTAVIRNDAELNLKHPNLKIERGDVRKKEDVSRFAKDHDVVIAFHEPTKENPREHVEIARLFIEGTKHAGVPHLVTVGHSFNKWTGNTQQAYETCKSITRSQREALNLFRNEKELNWSYACGIEPEKGGGNGEYRLSSDILFTYPKGEQRIQPGDFTEMVLNEAEKSALELHEHQSDEEEGL
ncbi:MAG: NAD(P)-dependent oxidoreductase [Bacteroidia bacterium]